MSTRRDEPNFSLGIASARQGEPLCCRGSKSCSKWRETLKAKGDWALLSQVAVNVCRYDQAGGRREEGFSLVHQSLR